MRDEMRKSNSMHGVVTDATFPLLPFPSLKTLEQLLRWKDAKQTKNGLEPAFELRQSINPQTPAPSYA
jgi:hypothetical protein